MSRLISLSVILLCLLAGQCAFAQAHTVTWNERIRSVDSTVMILGELYTIARMPVVEIGTGARHAVYFAHRDAATQGLVTATHDETPLQNSSPFPAISTTISGYPAQIFFNETITQSFAADGAGGYDFRVLPVIHVSVEIDIGDTILSLSPTLPRSSTSVSLGARLNAVRGAPWRKLTDDPEVIAGLDRWIDFIRVEPL